MVSERWVHTPPLIEAVRSGNLERLHAMLRQIRNGGKHSGKDSLFFWLGGDALSLAIRRNDETMINLLLQHGAALDWAEAMDETPLHAAIAVDRPDLVTRLLQEGADPLMGSLLGGTPDVEAAFLSKRFACLDVIIDAGADASNPTWLHQAVRLGALPCVKHLVRRGYDINRWDDTGTTPLIHAIRLPGRKRDNSCKHEMVQWLLHAGADPNGPDLFGMKPLHHAIVNDEVVLVDLLLSAGADPNGKDFDGRSPLDLTDLSSVRWRIHQAGGKYSSPQLPEIRPSVHSAFLSLVVYIRSDWPRRALTKMLLHFRQWSDNKEGRECLDELLEMIQLRCGIDTGLIRKDLAAGLFRAAQEDLLSLLDQLPWQEDA